jgi:hypothetical protein
MIKYCLGNIHVMMLWIIFGMEGNMVMDVCGKIILVWTDYQKKIALFYMKVLLQKQLLIAMMMKSVFGMEMLKKVFI